MDTSALTTIGTLAATILVLGTALSVALPKVWSIVRERIDELKAETVACRAERDRYRDEVIATVEQAGMTSKKQMEATEQLSRALRDQAEIIDRMARAQGRIEGYWEEWHRRTPGKDA